jgi:hypothetical protein
LSLKLFWLILKLVFGDETVQDVGLDPDEIAAHVGRLHLQARNRFPVGDRVEHPGSGDSEMGRDKTTLHVILDIRFQEGDMQHVMVFQDFPADAQLLRDESDRGDPAALSVSPVVHLPGGLVDVFAGYGFGAAETDDAAAALFLALSNGGWKTELVNQLLLGV